MFWFKLLSVFYNILQTAKYLWNTVALSFLAKIFAGSLNLTEKWGLFCSRNIMLSAMVCWYVFRFRWVLYYQFLIFSSHFCFSLHKGNFLKTRPGFWDGVFCTFFEKPLTTQCPLLFLQKSPSYMFEGFFNIPPRWCIWCKLDGVFLIKFSTFSILLFYLYIGNFFSFFYSILFFFWVYTLSFLSFLTDLVVYNFRTFCFIVSP